MLIDAGFLISNLLCLKVVFFFPQISLTSRERETNGEPVPRSDRGRPRGKDVCRGQLPHLRSAGVCTGAVTSAASTLQTSTSPSNPPTHTHTLIIQRLHCAEYRRLAIVPCGLKLNPNSTCLTKFIFLLINLTATKEVDLWNCMNTSYSFLNGHLCTKINKRNL